MKKVLLFILLVCSVAAYAQTDVGGTISTNTTWTLANSPYVVTSSVTVNSGVTLTVQSGVEVKFNDGFGMLINGNINATGATFTSNNGSPSEGILGTIQIGTKSTSYTGVATFSSCQFLYFDRIYVELGDVSFTNSNLTNFSYNGIHAINASDVTLNNTSLTNVGTSGNYVSFQIEDQATADITGGTIEGLNTDAVRVTNTANVSLDGVTIQSPNSFPVVLEGSPTVTYSNIAFSGNKYLAVAYNSSSITGDITLNNPGIPYYINSTTVQNGSTLTIASENIVKVNGTISVSGKLIAQAGSGEQIYFTSWHDDNLGGDSNGDGTNTSAGSSGWGGINFTNISDDASILDRVNIAYVHGYNDGAVYLENASPTITNSTFSNSYFGVVFSGASHPTFTGNTINSSQVTPIAMSFESSPVFSNNVFGTSDNTYDAIGLLGGTLTANATIIKRDFTTLPNVTYVMLSSITIPNGLSLTIDPGVVIKSLSNYSIINEGAVNVNGTSDEPVVFTSVNDDNYGNPNDTRNDGNTQTPGIGDFGGIYFGESASSSSVLDTAILKFSEFRGDFDITWSGNQSFYSSIAINGSAPSIRGCKITDATYGITLKNSTAIISGNEIVNATKAPIRMSISANPTFSDNVFTSVGWKGVAILPERITYTASLGKRDIAGLNNITYISEGFTIMDGAQITINPGIIIKGDRYSDIIVEGGFKIAGTETENVIITSIADDNIGASSNLTDNDTEGNGNATEPVSYEWGRIIFESSSDDVFSGIEHAQLLFGGYSNAPVMWDNAAASMSNSIVKFSNSYGLWFENSSTPIVDNVTIQSSYNDPIAISYFADPAFTNITFNANGSNGLALIEQTLSSDASLVKRDIAGINNIAYIMPNLTINSGATLTINPGVVLKLPGSQINVYEGAIKAIGTVAEPIIFTSTNDDSKGGDTNNDGNASTPSPGHWGGIDTYSSSMQSHLKYCEFRYGGNSRSYSEHEYTRINGHIISQDNNLLVENCVLQLVNAHAFGVYGTSTATFTANRIENLGTNNVPVHMSMFANPTFAANTVENVGLLAIAIKQETFTQDATFPFRDFASYDSITYLIGRVEVGVGTHITIPPGMVLKSGNSSGIKVHGRLTVAGTEADSVVFTTLSDDKYGRPRDTQNNGEQNSGIGGYWIEFENVSDDQSLIQHAIFRYSSEPVVLKSAAPTIQNSLFENSTYGIASSGLSEPNILNNTFSDLQNTPFYTSLVAWPTSMTGNVIKGTTWKGITIVNETLTQDTTLVQREFGGITNIPYIFQRYTVGTGVKLSIDPGVILKFVSHYSNYGYMNVLGSLEAIGEPTTDGTIVFTRLNDDFYGGNTESDNPTSYNFWDGISFQNESSDSQTRLENVIITKARTGLQLNSASPTIKNTLFLNNERWGLVASGASNPVLENNDFSENGNGSTSYGGFKNDGSFTIDATGSWWGHNSGPYHATDNVEGLGDQVMGNIIFDPWATDNSLNPITGDVSLNGHVSAFDAALTLQNLAALITLSARQDRAADVSDDKTISAMDASYILQYSAGLIQWFPAEAENKRITQQFASTLSKAVLTIDDATLANSAEELRIPVSIDEVGNLYALEAHIKVDKELELLRFEPASFHEVTFTSSINTEATKMVLAFAKATPVTSGGVLGHVVVRLKGDFSPKSELFITASKVVGNETDVTASSNEGRIAVSEAVLGVNDPLQQLLSIYPNPVSNNGTIQMVIPSHLQEKGKVEMHDMAGKVVYRKNISKNDTQVQIPVSSFMKGIYLLKVQIGDNLAESKVVID